MTPIVSEAELLTVDEEAEILHVGPDRSVQNPDYRLLDWIEHSVDRSLGERLREVIDDNPGRITRAYRELLGAPADRDYRRILKITKVVERSASLADVQVEPIEFMSMCAHHFLPFFGRAAFRYVPDQRVVGLGKIPRFVDAITRGFWIQEELTVAIAEEFARVIAPQAVSVSLEARHLCMCGRGPRSQATTVTSFDWAADQRGS